MRVKPNKNDSNIAKMVIPGIKEDFTGKIHDISLGGAANNL